MDYVKLLKVDAGPDAMKVVENGVTYKIPYGEVYKVNGKMREVIKPGKPYPHIRKSFVREFNEQFETIKSKEK